MAKFKPSRHLFLVLLLMVLKNFLLYNKKLENWQKLNQTISSKGKLVACSVNLIKAECWTQSLFDLFYLRYSIHETFLFDFLTIKSDL